MITNRKCPFFHALVFCIRVSKKPVHLHLFCHTAAIHCNKRSRFIGTVVVDALSSFAVFPHPVIMDMVIAAESISTTIFFFISWFLLSLSF